MSKSYDIYLQTQIFKFLRKVLGFVGIVLLLITIAYLIGEKLNKSNKQIQEQLAKIEMSSSKTNSLNANRESIKSAFANLDKAKQENKESGRQYIIEMLTKESANIGLSNFVIENISEKTMVIPKQYDDFAKNTNIQLFEVVVTFNNMMNSQTENFMNSITKQANGAVLINQIETKRVLENIDVDTIDAINRGNKISLLGTKIVIHWFFIK